MTEILQFMVSLGVNFKSNYCLVCQVPTLNFLKTFTLPAPWITPCLASAQPQVSCPREGPSPPSLIHMVELGFVGLLNNPRGFFAQVQKLEVKLART